MNSWEIPFDFNELHSSRAIIVHKIKEEEKLFSFHCLTKMYTRIAISENDYPGVDSIRRRCLNGIGISTTVVTD